ncbi:ribosomal-protein-S5-alanine N-acetyltransferase [compost metagenome]
MNLVVQYAFGDLDLHCIEAGAMPHNAGSLRVLEKAGFQQAGLARKNVMIAGKWEEHIMLSIMKPQD